MFYLSAVITVIFYTVVCCSSSTSKMDSSRLDKLIRWASSVVGMKLDSLVIIAAMRTLNKLLAIMDDASHPLHTVISSQRRPISSRSRREFRSSREIKSRRMRENGESVIHEQTLFVKKGVFL